MCCHYCVNHSAGGHFKFSLGLLTAKGAVSPLVCKKCQSVGLTPTQSPSEGRSLRVVWPHPYGMSSLLRGTYGSVFLRNVDQPMQKMWTLVPHLRDSFSDKLSCGQTLICPGNICGRFRMPQGLNSTGHDQDKAGALNLPKAATL